MRKLIVLLVGLLTFIGIGVLGAFMTGNQWGTKEFGTTVYSVMFGLAMASVFACIILDIDFDDI